jgi:hypothetical protein
LSKSVTLESSTSTANLSSSNAKLSTTQPPSGPLQQLLAAINEKKKQWNQSHSWAMRIIQQNRETVMNTNMEKAKTR